MHGIGRGRDGCDDDDDDAAAVDDDHNFLLSQHCGGCGPNKH